MPWYLDRRARFRGSLPWEIIPGNPRADNPVKAPETLTNLAKRGLPPGEHFRAATSTVEPLESVAPQVNSAVPIQVKDAPKANEGTTGKANIGSVLASDSVEGSESGSS
jgi:hypothetical protein